MTKAELNYILHRYRFIEKALKGNQAETSFYVGNRKETIIIDNQIKTVFSIIDDIMKNAEPMIAKIMKYRLKHEYNDYRISIEMSLSMSAYYRIKRTIENKIYQCCIVRGLVSYNELLNEKIG